MYLQQDTKGDHFHYSPHINKYISFSSGIKRTKNAGFGVVILGYGQVLFIYRG